MNFYNQLVSEGSEVEDQYLAIYELKHLNTTESIDALKRGFQILSQRNNPSVLILHEIAYAFGQVSLEYSHTLEPFLLDIINNTNNDPIVRHEATEALANLSHNDHTQLYENYLQNKINDPENILSDTCDVALQKQQSYGQLKQLYGCLYNGTREPAAPFTEQELSYRVGQITTQKLIELIEDQQTTQFDKYRTIYYIRNQKNPEQIIEMTKLMLSGKLNALIKHEISFILGQLGLDGCPQELLPILIKVCQDEGCPAIARHEALGAFQTINTNAQETQDFLKQYTNHPNQIIRETARVSLRVSEYWNKQQ